MQNNLHHHERDSLQGGNQVHGCTSHDAEMKITKNFILAHSECIDEEFIQGVTKEHDKEISLVLIHS